MERGRRIAAHEGYLDHAHIDELMEGVSAPACEAQVKIFKFIQSDIFGQMFGRGSWLTKRVFVKFCTIEMWVSQISRRYNS